MIAIAGRIGSGKDYLGSLLQFVHFCKLAELEPTESRLEKWLQLSAEDRYKASGWKIAKFADKLKDTICTMLGIDREYLDANKNTAVKGATVRAWLELIGGAARTLNPDLWLLDDTSSRQIVTDLRYPNELEFLQNHGAVCFKIERWLDSAEWAKIYNRVDTGIGICTASEYVLSTGVDSNAESYVDSMDIDVIENKGSLLPTAIELHNRYMSMFL